MPKPEYLQSPRTRNIYAYSEKLEAKGYKPWYPTGKEPVKPDVVESQEPEDVFPSDVWDQVKNLTKEDVMKQAKERFGIGLNPRRNAFDLKQELAQAIIDNPAED